MTALLLCQTDPRRSNRPILQPLVSSIGGWSGHRGGRLWRCQRNGRQATSTPSWGREERCARGKPAAPTRLAKDAKRFAAGQSASPTGVGSGKRYRGRKPRGDHCGGGGRRTDQWHHLVTALAETRPISTMRFFTATATSRQRNGRHPPRRLLLRGRRGVVHTHAARRLLRLRGAGRHGLWMLDRTTATHQSLHRILRMRFLIRWRLLLLRRPTGRR